MEFVRSLKRPFLDVRKLLLGVLFSIVPIVNFLSVGYILGSVKSVTARRPKFDLPEWENFWELFVKGALGFLAIFVYSLPLSILSLLFVKWGIADGGQVGSLSSGMAFLGLLIGVGGIMLTYIMPGALVNFSLKGRFRSAFEFSEIARRSFTGKYFLAWFVAMLYAALLSAGLNWIPYVGGAVASFVGGLTALTLIAEAY